jgi:hypothetical protein
VLIQLAQGMQESTRTKSDARGKFTLEVPDDGMHLVRVTHDKANYFRPLQEGTQSVEVEVFDAAAKVAGVTSEADVMRIETDAGGSGLRVVENFFLKNDSKPPMTQFGDRPFDFYLPAGAVVEGSAALAPGGMPVQAAPVPLSDGPNHFTFIFPIRPGETRFQITYKLPYSGSAKFSPRIVMPTDTVAVMMPKSMKFAGGQTSPYSAVNDEVDGQTYVARSVQPSQPLDFTVSGTGQLPRDTQAGTDTGAAAQGTADSSAQAQGSSVAGAVATERPGGGLGKPIDPEGTNDPWAKYRWWILGILGLALAAGAGTMLKASPTGGPAGTPNAVQTPAAPGVIAEGGAGVAGAAGQTALLQALKEELFALETDRLAGRISEAEYGEQKAALEVVLRRALGRVEAIGAASNR